MSPYWLCLVPLLFAAVLVVAACMRSSQISQDEGVQERYETETEVEMRERRA